MERDHDRMGADLAALPSPDWSGVFQSWWQIPLIISTSWWNTIVEAIWPDPAVEAYERREHDAEPADTAARGA